MNLKKKMPPEGRQISEIRNILMGWWKWISRDFLEIQPTLGEYISELSEIRKVGSANVTGTRRIKKTRPIIE